MESCIGQDDDFCDNSDSDALCQDDGTCDRSYCNDDVDECPSGTACNGDYCVASCTEDAECIERYDDDDFVCDADWSACLYRECDLDDDCGDGYYCSNEGTWWSCSWGCTSDSDCDSGDEYDCTDGCQADGRCDCTWLGCKAEGSTCDRWPRLECQDDGECGVGADDCASDDDCDNAQVCQYIPNWSDGASADESRLCGDSCVGQANVTGYGDSRPYCEYYFDYEKCDADTGTCYNCRSDADCADAERPTCYLGSNGNGCYMPCDDDDDCEDGDDECLWSREAQVNYCGDPDDVRTTLSPRTTTKEPTHFPTMEPTEDIVDNNSGAGQRGVVMLVVAMTGLVWWM